MAITASNSLPRARTKTVSPEIGPLTSSPRLPERLHRRGDDLCVLIAEQPALAGMRVERGDRDAGLVHAEAMERVEREFEDARQPLRRHQRRHLGERHVGRDMRDAELVVGEQHAGVAAAGEVGEHVGVPGIGIAGEVDRLLGNRAL